MLRSLVAILKIIQLLAVQAIAADTSSTGVDTADFGSLALLINVGTFTYTSSNKIALEIQHSDTDVDGDYVAVADGDLYAQESTGVLKILDNTGDDAKTYVGYYLGNKRFVRVRCNQTGTTTTAVLGIVAVEGHPHLQPPL